MKRMILFLAACFIAAGVASAEMKKLGDRALLISRQVGSRTDHSASPRALYQTRTVSQSPGVSIVGDNPVTFVDWQSNTGGDEKHLTVMLDGTAHAVFQGATDEPDNYNAYYSYSTDFGASWNLLGPVAPRNGLFSSLDNNSMGNAVIAIETNPTGLIRGPSVFIDVMAGFGIFTEFLAPRDSQMTFMPHVSVPTDDYVYFTSYAMEDDAQDMWNWCNPNSGLFGTPQNLFPQIDNEIIGCTVHSEGGKVTTLLTNRLDVSKSDRWGENNIIAMTSTDYGRTFGDPYLITNFTADTSLDVIPGLLLGLSALYVGEELHVVWDMVDDHEPAKDGIDYNTTTVRIMHWAENVNNGEPTVVVRWDSLHFAGDFGTIGGERPTGWNHWRIGYPKLGIDENGTLICAFVGFSGDSTLLDPESHIAYGDIWAVALADNGLQWGEPVNLTNSIDRDDRYPYLSQWNEAGKLNVLYQSDTIAGSFDTGEAPLGKPDHLFLKTDIPSTEPYTSPTAVQQISALPGGYHLEQNYPNPFNPGTTIRFSLAKNSRVKLTVYNLRGEKVVDLVDGPMGAGTHAATWHAGSQAAGLYFYRLQAGNVVLTRKMTLMK